jgi:hypothetical protein
MTITKTTNILVYVEDFSRIIDERAERVSSKFNIIVKLNLELRRV